MFDIGAIEHLLFLSQFFLEKKKISRSSIFCLFIIDSIYESSRKTSFLGSPKPRMDWIVSANEMNAEPVPNASPIRKFSQRE